MEEKHDFPLGMTLTDNKNYMRIFCENGSVFVKMLQLFGKKRMPIGEFLLGNKQFNGILLY